MLALVLVHAGRTQTVTVCSGDAALTGRSHPSAHTEAGCPAEPLIALQGFQLLLSTACTSQDHPSFWDQTSLRPKSVAFN